MSGIDVFEGKHMTSIMTFLLEREGSATRMQIYKGVANNDRMRDKLDTLERAGLVTQTQDGYSRATTVKLTPKGTEVATKLLDLDEYMRKGR